MHKLNTLHFRFYDHLGLYESTTTNFLAGTNIPFLDFGRTITLLAGIDLPGVVVSCGSSMDIRFTSDAYTNEGNFRGFRLKYEAGMSARILLKHTEGRTISQFFEC